jgi:6-phosphogluconolactonase
VPGDASVDDVVSAMDARDGVASAIDARDSGSNVVPASQDAGCSALDGEPADSSQHQGPRVVYAAGYAPDIHVFSVDPAAGGLTPLSSVTWSGANLSFLATSRGETNLYAVDENYTAGRVAAYAIGPGGSLQFLDAVSSGGQGPVHVALDATAHWALVANYGDGSVSVLPIQGDGSLTAPVQTITNVGTYPHMVVLAPGGGFVFVPCKGSDYVAEFAFDLAAGKLTPNATKPHMATAAGAGPRHLAFHPNGRFAYLINENDSTITPLAFDGATGVLSPLSPDATLSTLKAHYAGPDNTAAEVWVHPSGRWVVGSNRGDDSLVVFAVDASTGALTWQSRTPSGGMTPRDFAFDPTGTYLYAADQDSGLVVPFRFDSSAGTLAPVAAPLNVTAVAVAAVADLP